MGSSFNQVNGHYGQELDDSLYIGFIFYIPQWIIIIVVLGGSLTSLHNNISGLSLGRPVVHLCAKAIAKDPWKVLVQKRPDTGNDLVIGEAEQEGDT